MGAGSCAEAGKEAREPEPIVAVHVRVSVRKRRSAEWSLVGSPDAVRATSPHSAPVTYAVGGRDGLRHRDKIRRRAEATPTRGQC